MAARTSIVRAARQFISTPGFSTQWRCAAAPIARLRLQNQSGARCFSVNKALQEKKYTEDHEWIEVSSDGSSATLGISAYAAKALGDVVYVELPQEDLEIAAGDAIGAVESVKSASDINTPVSGTVTEVNKTLEETPGSLNKDPEGNGWIAKISIDKAEVESQSGGLMTKEQYDAFTDEPSEGDS